MTTQPIDERVERVVEEFEKRVFEIYPYRGAGRYENNMYIPNAKNWLRTTLHQELQKARKEELDRILQIAAKHLGIAEFSTLVILSSQSELDQPTDK